MTEQKMPPALPTPIAVVPATGEPKRRLIPIVIGAATLALALLGGFLVWHSGHAVNRTPLAGAPRPVSVVAAKASSFRESRTYVGTIQPWIEADIGPQYISAYVLTVLVRPGDNVAQGAISRLPAPSARTSRGHLFELKI